MNQFEDQDEDHTLAEVVDDKARPQFISIATDRIRPNQPSLTASVRPGGFGQRISGSQEISTSTQSRPTQEFSGSIRPSIGSQGGGILLVAVNEDEQPLPAPRPIQPSGPSSFGTLSAPAPRPAQPSGPSFGTLTVPAQPSGPSFGILTVPAPRPAQPSSPSFGTLTVPSPRPAQPSGPSFGKLPSPSLPAPLPAPRPAQPSAPSFGTLPSPSLPAPLPAPRPAQPSGPSSFGTLTVPAPRPAQPSGPSSIGSLASPAQPSSPTSSLSSGKSSGEEYGVKGGSSKTKGRGFNPNYPRFNPRLNRAITQAA